MINVTTSMYIFDLCVSRLGIACPWSIVYMTIICVLAMYRKQYGHAHMHVLMQ